MAVSYIYHDRFFYNNIIRMDADLGLEEGIYLQGNGYGKTDRSRIQATDTFVQTNLQASEAEYFTLFRLTNANATMVIGGNYNYDDEDYPYSVDRYATTKSGVVDERYNLYYRTYFIPYDSAAVRAMANLTLSIAAQNGTYGASVNSDDGIHVAVEARGIWTQQIFSSLNGSAIGYDVAKTLTVKTDVAGEVKALSEREAISSSTNNLHADAISYRANQISFLQNFRAKLDTDATLISRQSSANAKDGGASESVVEVTDNTASATGVRAFQSVDSKNGYWSGDIDAKALGSVAEIDYAAKTTWTNHVTGNHFDARGIWAAEDIVISRLSGDDILDSPGSITAQSSDNKIHLKEVVLRKPEDGHFAALKNSFLTGNSTSAYGMEAANIDIETTDKTFSISVAANDNYYLAEAYRSTTTTHTNDDGTSVTETTETPYSVFEPNAFGIIVINNLVHAMGLKANTITFDTFEASVSATASANRLTANDSVLTTNGIAAGYDVKNNQILVHGLHADSTLTAKNNLGGNISLAANDNETDRLELTGLHARDTLSVVGRIDTNITFNGNGNTDAHLTPTIVYGVNTKHLLGDAYSGTMTMGVDASPMNDEGVRHNASFGMNIHDDISTGNFIYADESGKHYDAFDINGTIVGFGVGIQSFQQLNLRISGEIQTDGYVIFAERYLDYLNEANGSYNITYDPTTAKNDRIELAAGAKVQGTIELWRGENTVIANSQTDFTGSIKCTGGKLNLRFDLEDKKNDEKDNAIFYSRQDDISLTSDITITVNLASAQAGEYTLYKYIHVDPDEIWDPDEYWTDGFKTITFAYHDNTQMVKLEERDDTFFTGTANFTDVNGNAISAMVKYNKETDTVSVVVDNTESRPSAIQVDETTGVQTISWESQEDAIEYIVDYTYISADGTLKHESETVKDTTELVLEGNDIKSAKVTAVIGKLCDAKLAQETGAYAKSLEWEPVENASSYDVTYGYRKLVRDANGEIAYDEKGNPQIETGTVTINFSKDDLTPTEDGKVRGALTEDENLIDVQPLDVIARGTDIEPSSISFHWDAVKNNDETNADGYLITYTYLDKDGQETTTTHFVNPPADSNDKDISDSLETNGDNLTDIKASIAAKFGTTAKQKGENLDPNLEWDAVAGARHYAVTYTYLNTNGEQTLKTVLLDAIDGEGTHQYTIGDEDFATLLEYDIVTYIPFEVELSLSSDVENVSRYRVTYDYDVRIDDEEGELIDGNGVHYRIERKTGTQSTSGNQSTLPLDGVLHSVHDIQIEEVVIEPDPVDNLPWSFAWDPVEDASRYYLTYTFEAYCRDSNGALLRDAQGNVLTEIRTKTMYTQDATPSFKIDDKEIDTQDIKAVISWEVTSRKDVELPSALGETAEDDVWKGNVFSYNLDPESTAPILSWSPIEGNASYQVEYICECKVLNPLTGEILLDVNGNEVTEITTKIIPVEADATSATIAEVNLVCIHSWRVAATFGEEDAAEPQWSGWQSSETASSDWNYSVFSAAPTSQEGTLMFTWSAQGGNPEGLYELQYIHQNGETEELVAVTNIQGTAYILQNQPMEGISAWRVRPLTCEEPTAPAWSEWQQENGSLIVSNGLYTYAGNPDKGGAQLLWQGMDGSAGYEVQYVYETTTISGITTTTTLHTGATTTTESHLDIDLPPHSVVSSWRVRGKGGTWSAWQSPDATARTATLSWHGAAAATTYEVEYFIDDGKSIVQKVSGNQNQLTIRGIDAGMQVKWRFRGNSDDGLRVTQWSDWQEFGGYTNPERIAPVMVEAMPWVTGADLDGSGTHSAIAIFHWENAITDAELDHYELEYFEDNDELPIPTVDSDGNPLDYQAALAQALTPQFDQRSPYTPGVSNPAAYFTKSVTTTDILASAMTNHAFVYWRVRAIDIYGQKSDYKYGDTFRVWTNDTVKPIWTDADTAIEPPKVKELFDTFSVEDGTIDAEITWNAAIDRESGMKRYSVEYKLEADDWTDRTKVKTFTLKASDSPKAILQGLDAASTYDFRIFGVDYVNNETSTPLEGKIYRDSAAPVWGDATAQGVEIAIPLDLTDPENPLMNVTVQWGRATDDGVGVKEYRLEYKPQDADWSEAASKIIPDAPDQGSFTATLTGLAGNLNYDYRVIAVDYVGNEADPLIGVIIPDTISPSWRELAEGEDFTKLEIVRQDSSTMDAKLTWVTAFDPEVEGTPSSGLLKYVIEYKQTAIEWDAAARLEFGPEELSYTFENLDVTRHYDYRLYAVDKAGNRSTAIEGRLEPSTINGRFGAFTTPVVLGEWREEKTTITVVDPETGESTSQEQTTYTLTGASVTLAWNDTFQGDDLTYTVLVSNDKDFLGNRVYSFETKEKGLVLDNSVGNAVSVLNGMDTVYYRVSVHDRLGNQSPYTGEGNFKFVASNAPSGESGRLSVNSVPAATSLTGRVQKTEENTSIAFSWNANSPAFGVYEYTLTVNYLGLDGKKVVETRDVDTHIRATSYTLADVADGEYTWSVTAASGAGANVKSTLATLTVDTTAPEFKDGFTNGTAVLNNFAITWTKATDIHAIDKYIVEYGTGDYESNHANWQRVERAGDATSYSGFITTNGIYNYRVTAVDAYGNVSDPLEGSFQIDAGNDFGNSAAEASTLPAGEVAASQSIGLTDPEDWFTFTTEADQDLYLTVANVRKMDSDGKGITVKVFNASNLSAAIASFSLASGDQVKQFYAKTAGTYLVQVTPIEPRAVMSYDVGFSTETPAPTTTDNTTSAAPALTLPSIADHKLETDALMQGWVGNADATDYGKVEVTTAGNYNFTLTGLASPLTLTLSTVNASGKTTTVKSVALTPKYDADAKKWVASVSTGNLLLETGTYYLAVAATGAKSNQNSSYTVALNAEVFDQGNTGNNSTSGASEPAQEGPAADDTETVQVNQVLLDNQWVGYGDPTDFVKVEVTKSGSYTFTVSGLENAVKMTLLNEKNKKVKNITVKPKKDKAGNVTANSTGAIANLLLEAGTYYVQVEATQAKKNLNTNYTVTLTGTRFVEANAIPTDSTLAGADATAAAHAAVSYDGETGAVASQKLVDHEWVGYGDNIDYRKVTIAQDGTYTFTLSGVSAASKMTIIGPDGKKKLASLSANGTKVTTVSSKALLLTAGDYYIAVENTKAKKGGFTNYDVAVSGTGFGKFQDTGDNTAALAAANDAYQKAITAGGDQPLVNDGWVGFGDTIDYRQLTVANSGTYTFTINGLTNAVKLTVFDANNKKLKSITVKGNANATGSGTIANLQLTAGTTYYVAVESTTWKKGLNTSYGLAVKAADGLYGAPAVLDLDAAIDSALDTQALLDAAAEMSATALTQDYTDPTKKYAMLA